MGSWGLLDMTTNVSESYKRKNQLNCLERQTKDGDSPVGENFPLTRGSQVPRDTSNPVGIREDHLPRLNTIQQPIAYKYREGKVKRTPIRGVK